ncbi:helix-turn-helix domain-containing protein [Paraburkholderia caffeinilytica]|uniref:hypothetical protein n=1 Tax=Paraburkholderia caffeinilytica TaxID=1761016 RepID=UPI0038BAF175
MHYKPLTPAALLALRDNLGYTNAQMAELFGVAGGQQFHKYISMSEKKGTSREMGFHVLMYGMLRLRLMKGPVESIEQLYEEAREHGAVIDPDTVGEPPQSQD